MHLVPDPSRAQVRRHRDGRLIPVGPHGRPTLGTRFRLLRRRMRVFWTRVFCFA
jgi:hypothetical protein